MKNTPMRTRLTLLAAGLALLAPLAQPARAAFPAEARPVLQQAMRDATESIRTSRIPADQTVSVLPIGNDQDGYIEALAKLALTDAGRKCVEGKDDPFWDEIIREIAWDGSKADMLDPDTLVKFGKLKATQILVYGNVRALEVNNRRIFVEIELHASSILTKEHLWGGIFTKQIDLTPGPAYSEDVRTAIQAALRDAADSLRAASLPANQTLSALPIGNDRDGYVESQIKLAVTGAGRICVEGKSDPFWDEVLKEVAWDERKADMLDAGTLVTFGKLKATQILIYGNVRAAEETNRRVFVEIELHASSVITKQHLWGGTFTKRHYTPGDDSPEGLSAIPAEIREPMRKLLSEQAETSLRGQAKLQAVRNVAFVPLAGDFDRYATFIIRDAVSQTALNPKELDIGTLGEARRILRDQPQQADALLYGALRDVSRKIVGRTPRSVTYEVRTELQACIENAATRELLWSASLFGKANYTDVKTWWQWATEDAIPYLQAHPLVWMVPLALLIILIILNKITRAATRVR